MQFWLFSLAVCVRKLLFHNCTVVLVFDDRGSLSVYLSTTLAGLILSMTMACLFKCMAVVRVIPRLAPGALAISTSRGPEAFVTESEGR